MDIRDYQKLDNGTIIDINGKRYVLYFVKTLPDMKFLSISLSASRVLHNLPDVILKIKGQAFPLDNISESIYVDVYKDDFTIVGKADDNVLLRLQMLGYLKKENIETDFMHLQDGIDYKLEMMPQSFYTYANARDLFADRVKFNTFFSLGLKIVKDKVEVKVLSTDDVILSFVLDLNKEVISEFEKQIIELCRYNIFRKGLITTYTPRKAKGKLVELTDKEFIEKYLALPDVGIQALKTLRKKDFYYIMYNYVASLNKNELRYEDIEITVNQFKTYEENQELVKKIENYVKPNGMKHFSFECEPKEVPLFNMYGETTDLYLYETIYGSTTKYYTVQKTNYENWLKEMFNDTTATTIVQWSLESRIKELGL